MISDKLRILTRPIEGACTVDVWWGIACGSGDDPEGKSGLAHLTEHLLGQEMNRLGPLTIPSCGGTVTAHTGLDITSFAWTLPACYWNPAMLSGIFAYAGADSAEGLVIEKSVVLAERERQRTDNSWRLSTMVFREVFRGRGYGRPVIGLPKEIASLTIEDVAAQRRSYRTSEQTIVLAGAIDPDSIASVFGTVAEHSLATFDASQSRSESRESILPKPYLGRDGLRFHALIPVPPAMHADALPLLLASMMTGASPWWRPAMERSWNPEPRYASSFSPLKIDYGLHRKTGLWHVSGLTPNPAEQIKNFIDDQLRVCFFGCASENSLEIAKVRALRSLAYTLERPASHAAWLGRMAIFLGLCDERQLQFQLQAIGLADIQRVVDQHLLRAAGQYAAAEAHVLETAYAF